MTSTPRGFQLLRHQDISGVSGTGVVADGVLWPDGTASLRWKGERPSTVHWDRIADAEAVHGHGGATEIVWLDDTGQPGLAEEYARGWIDIQSKYRDALQTISQLERELYQARQQAIRFQTRLDEVRNWARRNLPVSQQERLAEVLRGDVPRRDHPAELDPPKETS